MVFPIPIPPKPPWYSTPTAIASLPTAVPISCNSLIESPTDTPATENRQNKSYDNIENKIKNNNNNDRPDDDVDCFPRQDKQPVSPQDISTTNNLRPSLIESPTDKSTANCNNTSNDNIEHDRPDVDCIQRPRVILQQEQEQKGYSFSIPAYTHNPTQAPRKPTPKRTLTKQSAYRGFENTRPDNDNNNNNNDDDVDCFPRQDKQPVLPQDISPNAPTASTANNTSPSLIETPTAPMNTDNNNNNNKRRRPAPARTNRSAHRGFKTKTKPTHTVVPTAPLLVWDGTQYQLDYNHDHRPISTWNGTTHTDIAYDDDYDCRTDYDYADGDSLNMNDPSVRLQFTQCLKTVQFNNYLQDAHHINTATTNDTPHANQRKHKTTTMKETHNDPPPTYQYNTPQLLFLTTHYETASNDYTEEFPLYTVPLYITRTKQHRPSHDNYLYHRWNNPAARSTHKKNRKSNQRHRVTTKDDTSVTPTLETISTLDTRSSHPTNIDTDTILSITIWNQPIAQYRMPNRPSTPTRNQSRHPSTAVQYALIGVYDKLLNPSEPPRLLLFFASIISAALSCFILLADSFTMVKIDDRYPDEWND